MERELELVLFLHKEENQLVRGPIVKNGNWDLQLLAQKGSDFLSFFVKAPFQKIAALDFFLNNHTDPRRTIYRSIEVPFPYEGETLGLESFASTRVLNPDEGFLLENDCLFLSARVQFLLPNCPWKCLVVERGDPMANFKGRKLIRSFYHPQGGEGTYHVEVHENFTIHVKGHESWNDVNFTTKFPSQAPSSSISTNCHKRALQPMAVFENHRRRPRSLRDWQSVASSTANDECEKKNFCRERQ
ncbi:hypothetical protein Gasu2_33410 [Galdieria sulphuraria]|nr:hypothetical protein Gasu2_33410 [Galdieria sulphuraria]